jgi:hypothetical protein
LSDPRTLLRGVGRASGWALIAVAPLFTLIVFRNASRAASLGFDLERIALPAARQFVHGRPLYLTPSQWHHLTAGSLIYVYPPLYAELLVPLLLLPTGLVVWLASLASVAAALLALRIAGLHDLRALALVMVSPPVLYGGQVANVSAVVCLLTAIVWRGRNLPLAAAVALKLWVWPLFVWMAFRRGVGATAICVSTAAVAIFASWAVIGFEGLRNYPTTLSNNDRGQSRFTFALSGMMTHGQIVGIALACIALLAGWRRSQRGDDTGAFTYSILAALLASPIVWGYYFVLAMIPLAIRQPRLHPTWLLPLCFWIGPTNSVPPRSEKLITWAITIGLLIWLAERAPETSQHEAVSVLDRSASSPAQM